jgi:hypothetical protein
MSTIPNSERVDTMEDSELPVERSVRVTIFSISILEGWWCDLWSIEYGDLGR